MQTQQKQAFLMEVRRSLRAHACTVVPTWLSIPITALGADLAVNGPVPASGDYGLPYAVAITVSSVSLAIVAVVAIALGRRASADIRRDRTHFLVGDEASLSTPSDRLGGPNRRIGASKAIPGRRKKVSKR